VIEEQGTLTLQDVTRIGSEVAAALGVAHQAGIVHRDVKPGNVLIGEDGSARLTDFGISHAFGDVSLTSSGMVTGTPAYLAPEVARGAKSSFASDVFSLGATLYTALEGTTPVDVDDDDNPMAVLHRVASGQIRPPRRGTPLEPLLVQMLAVDPQRRPSVTEVAAQLARLNSANRNPAAALTTDRLPKVAPAPPSTTVSLPAARPAAVPPVLPAPPPVIPAEPPRRRRSPWPVAIAIVAALLLVGIVILVATSLGGGSGSAPPAAADSTSQQVTPSHTKHQKKSESKPPKTHSSKPHVSKTTVTRTSERTVTTSATTSPAAPPPGGTNASDQIGAVDDYYGLLPDDTADAWNRLTAGYQAQAGGRSNYESFWSGFRSVSIGNEQFSGGVVLADLTYTRTDGSQTSETRSFSLVDEGGILKIADSQVVG
jgi:serine/threonine protein kinase